MLFSILSRVVFIMYTLVSNKNGLVKKLIK